MSYSATNKISSSPSIVPLVRLNCLFVFGLMVHRLVTEPDDRGTVVFFADCLFGIGIVALLIFLGYKASKHHLWARLSLSFVAVVFVIADLSSFETRTLTGLLGIASCFLWLVLLRKIWQRGDLK